MAKLVFLRRTEKDIQVFGGDVYFDIDGKNVGKLSRVNQEVSVPAGLHTIKMYKSHTYDTFIGFAETTMTTAADPFPAISDSMSIVKNAVKKCHQEGMTAHCLTEQSDLYRYMTRGW